MNIAYLRSRAKQFRNARNEVERIDLLYKLARHLNLIGSEERLTLEHQHKVATELRGLGISVNYQRKEQNLSSTKHYW